MSNKNRNVVLERFFNTLISGDRNAARAIIDEALEADVAAEAILSNLFWPTLEHIQQLYRADQLSAMAHHYATRLLRMLADQMQLRLTEQPARGKQVLVLCGPEEPEELAAQMTADLLEAAGFGVQFAGGGIANDEIIAQISDRGIDVLAVFGATAGAVPYTRQLIDRLHEMEVRSRLQIVVGGGVFNRAEGLAEEIGADLWAKDPQELVDRMIAEPNRRMASDQRTVGRKRRTKRTAAA